MVPGRNSCNSSLTPPVLQHQLQRLQCFSPLAPNLFLTPDLNVFFSASQAYNFLSNSCCIWQCFLLVTAFPSYWTTLCRPLYQGFLFPKHLMFLLCSAGPSLWLPCSAVWCERYFPVDLVGNFSLTFSV